jgi:hypothetical protein
MQRITRSSIHSPKDAMLSSYSSVLKFTAVDMNENSLPGDSRFDA